MVDPLHREIADKTLGFSRKASQNPAIPFKTSLEAVYKLLFDEFRKIKPKAIPVRQEGKLLFAIEKGYGPELLKIINSSKFASDLEKIWGGDDGYFNINKFLRGSLNV